MKRNDQKYKNGGKNCVVWGVNYDDDDCRASMALLGPGFGRLNGDLVWADDIGDCAPDEGWPAASAAALRASSWRSHRICAHIGFGGMRPTMERRISSLELYEQEG